MRRTARGVSAWTRPAAPGAGGWGGSDATGRDRGQRCVDVAIGAVNG